MSAPDDLRNKDDPWRIPLERIRGQIGDDGIERGRVKANLEQVQVSPAVELISRKKIERGQMDLAERETA